MILSNYTEQPNVAATQTVHTIRPVTMTNVSIHAHMVATNVAVMLNVSLKIIEPIANVQLVRKEIH